MGTAIELLTLAGVVVIYVILDKIARSHAPPARFHGWSRLPDELKVAILAHNLDQPDAVDANTHNKVLKQQLKPIIGTRNRELVSLALETYYNRNTFKVTIATLPSWKPTRVSRPPAAAGHLIRVMEVQADGCWFICCDSLEDMLVKRYSGWKPLLTPSRPFDKDFMAQWTAGYPGLDLILSRDRCAWQASFSNLRTLHFSLKSPFPQIPQAPHLMEGRCDTCGGLAVERQRLLERLQETSIELRATKTTAVIDHIPFSIDVRNRKFVPRAPVFCECSRPISDRIVQMATKPKD